MQMPVDDEDEVVVLEANETAPPPPLKFKVTTPDGFSGTTTLDAAWQAKPFLTAVVKPVVLKLNKRLDKEPVSANLLDRVEVDGEEVAEDCDLAKASVSSVVAPGSSEVQLTFGIAPPRELKFAVEAYGGETSFTITLDAKFMQKSFHDAVIVPFVKYYNKRVHLPVEASSCVQVNIDGVKAKGSMESVVRKKTALQFVGRAPAVVTLFFSWEAVTSAERAANKTGTSGRGYSQLPFKVACSKMEHMCKDEALDWDHKELSPADGIELSAKIFEYGPLDKLRHYYLHSNSLGDVGVAAVGRCINGKFTKNMKRLDLSHNKISSAGIVALVGMWSGASRESPHKRELEMTDEQRKAPHLDLLNLEHNRIGDEGVHALCDAVESGALKCREVRLFGNGAITPAARSRAYSQPIYRQGCGVIFEFDDLANRAPVFDQEGKVVAECDDKGSIFRKIPT